MIFVMNEDRRRFWGGKPSNLFPIILLSGKAGVGKSTVADKLSRFLLDSGIKSIRTPFAGAVKDTARVEFGWDGKKDDKGRRLLQNIGQMGREYNQDIWAIKVGRIIQDCIFDGDYDCAIIDDWRYPNEYHYLESTDNFYLYSVRVIAPNHEILKGTEYYNHPSEISIGDEDFYNQFIDNDKRGDLKREIRYMAHSVFPHQISKE